jgi:serine/threonine protein phosphatase PrpC
MSEFNLINDSSLISEFRERMTDKSSGGAKQLRSGQDVAMLLNYQKENSEEGELPVEVCIVLDGHGNDLVIDTIREETDFQKHFSKDNPAESLQQLIETGICVRDTFYSKWNPNGSISYNTYLKKKLDDKKILCSGSTLSFVKIFRNVKTKSMKIVSEWLGDSTILVFINNNLEFISEGHHANSDTECQRLRDKGVLKSVIQSNDGFQVLSEDTIISKPGKYVDFNTKTTHKLTLACTRSLGHNRITGIDTQQHIIECSTDDEVKVIVGTDGVFDVINVDVDMEKLRTYSAYELLELAEKRWKQSWKYNDTIIRMSSYDDCGCVTWHQKKK